MLPCAFVRFNQTPTRHLSENPRQAIRLLRHLHLAQVLWGREVALPIAAVDAAANGGRVGVLRALLHLEREGAVVIHRLFRAVYLARPPLEAASEAGIAYD